MFEPQGAQVPVSMDRLLLDWETYESMLGTRDVERPAALTEYMIIISFNLV